jgi:hypothetical protein
MREIILCWMNCHVVVFLEKGSMFFQGVKMILISQ